MYPEVPTYLEMPKDDGLAVMVSAIVSPEFGFGVEWMVELQNEVNEYRRGKKYSDKDAAMRLRNTAHK